MEASVCRLEIDGEELGKYVLRFERETLPLRWVLNRCRNKTSIRLIDDTGLEEAEPEISFFPMERPVEPQSLPFGESVCGISEPGGGLFVARKGKYQDAVILSPETKSRGFGELEPKPEFPEFLNGRDKMAEALRLYEFWWTARFYGPLAGIRQKKISDSILNAVCLALCAQRWSKAETAFLDAPGSTDASRELERAVGKNSPGFASALSCCCLEVRDKDFSLVSDRYSELAKKYSVCRNRELCDFALALAGGPDRFPRVLDHDLDKKLGEIRKNPTVLRGARFIAVVLGWRT